MSAVDTLKDAAAKHDTPTLLGALAILSAKPKMNEYERVTHAAIADVVAEREGIDAILDGIFFDDTFSGTYYDAILAAIATRDAEIGQQS